MLVIFFVRADDVWSSVRRVVVDDGDVVWGVGRLGEQGVERGLDARWVVVDGDNNGDRWVSHSGNQLVYVCLSGELTTSNQ